jgi:hypothetical protein
LKRLVRKLIRHKPSDEAQTPPEEAEPAKAKPLLRFQLSLKALIFIHILIACVIGIWIHNQTFGIIAAVALVACLLVVYVDEEWLLSAAVLMALMGGMFYLSWSNINIRPRSGWRPPPPPPLRLPPELAGLDDAPKRQLNAMGIMVESFYSKYSRYPDDSDAHHFYRELMNFDVTAGGRPALEPYVTKKDREDESFSNPMGTPYAYKILRDEDGTERSFVLIDLGEDGLLGGTIDPGAGFMPDRSKRSHDNLIYINMFTTDPLK